MSDTESAIFANSDEDPEETVAPKEPVAPVSPRGGSGGSLRRRPSLPPVKTGPKPPPSSPRVGAVFKPFQVGRRFFISSLFETRESQ